MSVETSPQVLTEQRQWTETDIALARSNVAELNDYLQDKSPFEVSAFMLDRFGHEQAHAISSAGFSAVVLLDNLKQVTDEKSIPNLPVVHTDTGFLMPEVAEYRDYLRRAFDFPLTVIGPSQEEIDYAHEQRLYEADPPNEYRLLTKYGPIDKYIGERAVRLLFTGVRRDQTQNRDELAIVTFGSNGELRVNPNFHMPKAEASLAIAEITGRRNLLPHPLSGRIDFVEDVPFLGKPKAECGINSARRLVRPPSHVMEDLVALELPAA